MHTDLALDALDMELWARDRAGQGVAGLIHHSDRGVQCRAIRYTERLAEAEAVTSVGSKGDSYDNAMAEAFNSLFKAECIRNPIMRPRGGWGGVSEVEIAVAEYIEVQPPTVARRDRAFSTCRVRGRLLGGPKSHQLP